MNRRRILVLLGVTLAGCSGSQPTSTEAPTETQTATREPTATASASPTATATSTATETPTPEPTATPEQTPTDAERRGTEAITMAKREFNVVIRAYTSEIDDDEITDVTAATGYYSRGVEAALADAQKAYQRAEDRAVTRTQTTAATDLVTTWQFFRLANRAQEALVETYGFLDGALDAALEDDFTAVRAASTEINTRFRDARAPKNDLEADIDGEALEVIDDLSERDYDTKVTQFEGEVQVFDEVRALLEDLADALSTLDDARDAADAGETEDARDRGNDAAAMFDDLVEDFEDLAEDDNPDGGESCTEILLEFADLAVDKKEAARDVV